MDLKWDKWKNDSYKKFIKIQKQAAYEEIKT